MVFVVTGKEKKNQEPSHSQCHMRLRIHRGTRRARQRPGPKHTRHTNIRLTRHGHRRDRGTHTDREGQSGVWRSSCPFKTVWQLERRNRPVRSPHRLLSDSVDIRPSFSRDFRSALPKSNNNPKHTWKRRCSSSSTSLPSL